MRNFKIISIFMMALTLLSFFIFSSDEEVKSDKPSVTVSVFSLYDVVRHIAHDHVNVVNILPFGVDPHSFAPTPKLMASIENSSLLFYSGAGLEPWIHGVEFKNRAIDISKYVKLRELGAKEMESHEHYDEEPVSNKTDPHYWLDFENMKSVTNVITDELIKLTPQNKADYVKNRDVYLSMLDKLNQDFLKKLSSCKLHTTILSHNAIGYLAKRYNFNTESLTGLSPETEPTAKDITRILAEVERHGVKTVFFENFVNDDVIKNMAKDANVNIEVFQPLGNLTADEAAKKLTYEDVMRLNLEKLSKALDCD